MMNILLPTDFSENSRKAAAYALQFFREIPCKFHLLHVLPYSPEKLQTSTTDPSVGINENFDKLLTWLNAKKHNAEHNFSIYFRTDYLIEAVRELVTEKQIDLILMSTRGDSGGGSVIGKNTLDVMTKVKCPVLAVSEEAEFHEYREILFPTDYKIRYNSKMLETLLNFTSLSKATVKILELFTSDKEPSEEQIANRNFLQSSFSPKVPLLQTCYIMKDSSSATIFGETNEVDMIVMAAKNLSICQKLLKQKQNPIPFMNKLPLLVLHG